MSQLYLRVVSRLLIYGVEEICEMFVVEVSK
ncbi:MAG: hypothetical protein ACI97K_002563, partial [Glaciecola sp.]